MKQRYPENMMIRFYEGKLAQINGKLDVAQKCFEPRESDEQSFKVKVDMILNLKTFKRKKQKQKSTISKVCLLLGGLLVSFIAG